MCAMYGCPVSATAEAIDPISRSFREAAISRRLAVMRRVAGTDLGNGEAVAASILPSRDGLSIDMLTHFTLVYGAVVC